MTYLCVKRRDGQRVVLRQTGKPDIIIEVRQVGASIGVRIDADEAVQIIRAELLTRDGTPPNGKQ